MLDVIDHGLDYVDGYVNIIVRDGLFAGWSVGLFGVSYQVFLFATRKVSFQPVALETALARAYSLCCWTCTGNSLVLQRCVVRKEGEGDL